MLPSDARLGGGTPWGPPSSYMQLLHNLTH